MSYRNRTLSEKKRIYKKLGLVITAILVVCIVLAIAQNGKTSVKERL